MKASILTLVYIFTIVITSFCQSIGIGTTTPDPSAQLDVSSNNKGFLPPRLALTATNVVSPVASPATGLLVYNTATAGVSPNNVIPGYYYWNGSLWYPVVNKGNSVGDMQYWDGIKWVTIPLGPNNSVLTICQGIPTWGGCPSISISPENNLFEGIIDSHFPTIWSTASPAQIDIAAWTNGGPENRRSCIKFDYSSIPAGVTIDSAILYLYSTPNPQVGNYVDAQYGTANAGYVQRITTNWTVANQFNWNNQPATTTVNQAIISQSAATNDNSAVNVTALVKDMITNGNNGFFLRLQAEATYNIRQWASSYFSDVSKHPKLVIKYH